MHACFEAVGLFADHHDARLGQEPALIDLPHLNHVNTGSYQSMIVEDDDWLRDFALSHSSPTASAAAAASHEHTAEHKASPKPDHSDHSTSAQSGQHIAGDTGADAAAAEPADLQVCVQHRLLL